MLPWTQSPHRRFNPLKGEWVLVSPHRATRPGQGQVEETPNNAVFQYDASCYLCPGNSRAQGIRNPAYHSTFVFDNDPREAAVKEWAVQTRDLPELPCIEYGQIFENRGAMAGTGNPHGHCQIWACESVPDEIVKESAHQHEHLRKHGTCMLCDYMATELYDERLICANEMFAAFVPFWALWPFEALVIGTRHISSLDQMSPPEHRALGDILKQLTTRYDALFKVPFPYTMGIHQSPKESNVESGWHMHAHFYPPLLRSSVRKFMVGYELLAGPQRDLTPEEAARRLREAAG